MRERGNDIEHSNSRCFISISMKRLKNSGHDEKKVRCVNAEIICAVTFTRDKMRSKERERASRGLGQGF